MYVARNMVVWHGCNWTVGISALDGYVVSLVSTVGFAFFGKLGAVIGQPFFVVFSLKNARIQRCGELNTMPTNYYKISWTQHSQAKMRQYGFSTTKLLNVLRKPERTEQGIAQGTLAVMQTKKVFGNKKLVTDSVKPFYSASIKKAPGEIWLMYKDDAKKGTRTIISAWRYPGVSKPGEPVPIPEEIRKELLGESNLKFTI